MSSIYRQYHFGVYGLIMKNEKILVVKKSRGPYKGLFDLPGGRPLGKEEPCETLCREVKEETGIDIKVYSFHNYLTFFVSYRDLENELCELHHTAIVYRIVESGFENFDPLITLEDVEGSPWIEHNEIRKENSSSLLLRALYMYVVFVCAYFGGA